MPRTKPEIVGDSANGRAAVDRLRRENDMLRAALSGSQRFLSGIANVSSDLFWQTDADHRISYFSPSGAALFGGPVEHQIGKTCFELTCEDTDTESWHRHRDDLEARRPYDNFAFDFINAHGDLCRVDTSGRPDFDEDGNFLGYIGVARDVTGGRARQVPLAVAKISLQQAIDALDASITVWDAGDRLVMFNNHFRRLVDGIPEYAMPYGMLFEEHVRKFGKDHVKTGELSFEEWVKWRIDHHQKPVGSLQVERHNGTTVLIDEAKIGKGVTITIVNDITAIKRTENLLRASEQRLRDFGSVASDWVWEMGPDLRFTYISAQSDKHMAMDEADVIGRTRRDLGLEGVTEAELCRHEADLAARRPFYDFRYYKTRPDGRRFFTSVSGKPVYDDEGEFVGYRGVGRDITEFVRIQEELRAAKERAEQASRAKSEFLAHMSHELRTPLNAILGFSEIITCQLFGPIGNGTYAEYAGDIKTSGEHLLSLINDLLDLSKIEAGKFELLDEDLDIRQLVEQTEKLFRHRFEKRGIAFSADIAPSVHRLRADRRAISQILYNIVSNAEKYNRENGRIDVNCGRDAQGMIRLCVTDTGYGFDASDVEKAMSPFGRIENPMTAVAGGTGLGLPIVHALMQLHDGTVQVSSEINVGTKVSLVFPAYRSVDT